LACPDEQYGRTRRTAAEAKNPRFTHGQSLQDREIITRVATVAVRRGWSMTEVSLAWLNKRVTAPVIGFTSIKRIEEALSVCDEELTEEEEVYMEEPYYPKPIEGHF
jgi:aryl-alcohol dehydrogenase-like predicted oxidoreductase